MERVNFRGSEGTPPPHHVTKAVPHSTALEYAEHGNNEHGINFSNFGRLDLTLY